MKIFSVSEINGYVKAMLEEDELLGDVRVSGEISNLKRPASGHMYFSLKDENGQLAAAMFKWQRQYMRFSPTDGMRVIAHGRITLYEASGQYQMIVSSLEPDGVGALYAAYEKLKARLEAEGLFAAERKRPIPAMPRAVGVVTSKTGAAVRDIINIITRRFPMCRIVLAPVAVQGADAPGQIVAAIKEMNEKNACDVMIVGRGGGSAEDLWSFNDEAVARAVAGSHIPVISAVGHETDFTLCDFAADLRAPTPSAAAELAVPDSAVLRDTVAELSRSINASMRTQLDRYAERIAACTGRRCMTDPSALYELKAQRLDMLGAALERQAKAFVGGAEERLTRVAARLEALSPMAVLGRGYAMIERGGEVIVSSKRLSVGDDISIRLCDGTAEATISEVRGESA